VIVTEDNINVEPLIVLPRATAELPDPSADIVTALRENVDDEMVPSTRRAEELAADTLTDVDVMSSVKLVNEPTT
jgi:hypothetical protein